MSNLTHVGYSFHVMEVYANLRKTLSCFLILVYVVICPYRYIRHLAKVIPKVIEVHGEPTGY